MKQTLDVATPTVLTTTILGFATRQTIGSTICFTEGVGSTIVTALPKDQWYYIVGVMLTFSIWWAFWLFRGTKLGADVLELSLYELAAWAMALTFFKLGQSTAIFWYVWLIISVLKITRVYARKESVTQRSGWGVFGIVTYLYQKKHGKAADADSNASMARALGLVLAFAAVCSVLVSQTSDLVRVGGTWAVALFFDLVYGPLQLRNLANFIPTFMATSQRADELADKVVKQDLIIEGLGDPSKIPPEHMAALVDAYLKTADNARGYLIEMAQTIANTYPPSTPPTDRK